MMYYRCKNGMREKWITCVGILIGLMVFVALAKTLTEIHFERLLQKSIDDHKPCTRVLEMMKQHFGRVDSPLDSVGYSSLIKSQVSPQSHTALGGEDQVAEIEASPVLIDSSHRSGNHDNDPKLTTTAKKIVPSVKRKKSPNGTVVFQNLIANISHSNFNNSVNYSMIYESRFLDHETPLVTSFRCPHSYHIIILITSEIRHFGRREWIRKTWGRDHVSPKARWKTFFLIGRIHDSNSMIYDLAQEINKFNDIILIDTYEDFYNLVPKLQAAFEWSSKYCDFNYLLKGDDDIFVNIVQLFWFVDSDKTPKTSLYGGHAYRFGWVQRRGRYGMSRKEYWRDTYPPYCSGGGYVLSKDVPPKFLKALRGVKVIRIDDAYIGELALRAEVNVYHHTGFRFQEGRDCGYREENIVHHPVNSWLCMQTLYNKSEPLLTQKLRQRVF